LNITKLSSFEVENEDNKNEKWDFIKKAHKRNTVEKYNIIIKTNDILYNIDKIVNACEIVASIS
jgi:hypothetical protein